MTVYGKTLCRFEFMIQQCFIDICCFTDFPTSDIRFFSILKRIKSKIYTFRKCLFFKRNHNEFMLIAIQCTSINDVCRKKKLA